MKKIYCVLFVLFFAHSIIYAQDMDVDTISTHAFRILSKLNGALIQHIQQDKQNSDYGGILCPHCLIYHTRAAEAVYPLSYEYQQTQNSALREIAINLGNWLIKQQETDGSWKETPEEWTGTTTDQTLMMALAFPILKPYLTKVEERNWLSAIEKASDYLTTVMSPEFASINYCATTTTTLMQVNTLIPKQEYVSKAHKLAHQVIAKMDFDYFLTGEGGRVFDVKYGVDLGYNLEMSLWGLTLYARLANDTLINNHVEEALKRHIGFVYPNGTIDNSWGIRSNKWTCFGGATSDGCHILFSLWANKNDIYRTAAIRNMNYLEKCLKDGHVGFGPMYYDIFKTLPCIYSTFAKAKSMAMSMQYVTSDIGKMPPLPLDNKGLHYYPTLNVATARTSQWCATVSAYGYKDPAGAKSKYMHRPTGGSICNLWLKGHGYFQASSQTIYKRWEPMNFPEIPEPLPLTPRIEFTNSLGYFTNLYEFDATLQCSEEEYHFCLTSLGELKNCNQQEGGISYRLTHHIGDSFIEKHIELIYHNATDKVQIIEPIIQYPDMIFIPIDKKTVRIHSKDSTIELHIESENVFLQLGNNESKYCFSYPALKAYPITLSVEHQPEEYRQTIIFKYRIIN